jgi:hypothetical protein
MEIPPLIHSSPFVTLLLSHFPLQYGIAVHFSVTTTTTTVQQQWQEDQESLSSAKGRIPHRCVVVSLKKKDGGIQSRLKQPLYID